MMSCVLYFVMSWIQSPDFSFRAIVNDRQTVIIHMSTPYGHDTHH